MPRILKRLRDYSRATKLHRPDLVVLCGCDGAGKSTIVEHAVAQLTAGGLELRAFHFNRHLGLINFGKSAQRRDRQTMESTGEEVAERSATMLENACRLASGLDRFLGLLLRRWRARGECTFLLDRYFIDYFLRDRIVNVMYSRALRHLMFRLFPRPHCVFYVYARPEQIAERKMEYGNLQQIQREIALYTRYLRRVYPHLDLLRNDDLESSVTTLVRRVFEARAARCRRLLEGEG